jgi:hypothetical protein
MDICKCSGTVHANWGTTRNGSNEVCNFCEKELHGASAVVSEGKKEEKSSSTLIESLPPIELQGPITLDDLYRAQNKTTRAVRAIAEFLIFQVTAIAWALIVERQAMGQASSMQCLRDGDCGLATFLDFAAFFILMFGTGLAISRARTELNQADPSKR